MLKFGFKLSLNPNASAKKTEFNAKVIVLYRINEWQGLIKLKCTPIVLYVLAAKSR